MSDIFGFSITSAALVMSVMGLLFTAAMPEFDHWSKRFFQCYFVVFILCCLTSFADLLLFGHPIPHGAVYLVMVLECLFLALPLPMLTVYLLHCCGETMPRGNKLLRAVLSLWAVYVVLLASAELTGVFIYAASDNYYYRGSLYPLLLLPLVVILLLNLAGVVRRRAQLSRKVFLSFVIAITPMTAALVAHMFIDVLPLVDIGFIVSALAMFVIIQNDQTERYIEKERENAQLRTDIMLSQIQPHFLYNTLGAIKSVCRTDPMRARDAIDQFTEYLRHNMDALTDDQPISFPQELEHVKRYLDIQKLRFDTALNVEYDLACTDFKLPTLTLQPIVENAVTHGVRKNSKGNGLVTIRSRECPDRYEISVTDNGPGFVPDTAPGDGERSHVGIKNVRERLRYVSGGELEIHSVLGEGTTVTLILPKEKRG